VSDHPGLFALVGRVVDPDGAPVPEAVVVIVAGSVPMPEIGLLCDGDGRFSLRLTEGVFTLRAHGPAGTGEAAVRSPPSSGEVRIVLGQSGGE
jgi:hypothetical protein